MDRVVEMLDVGAAYAEDVARVLGYECVHEGIGEGHSDAGPVAEAVAEAPTSQIAAAE